MSDARNGRFEIDLEEIEKQLRRSVEAPQPARSDPLAELARIVGQEDPFRGIFAKPPGKDVADNAPAIGSAGPRPGAGLGAVPPAAETPDAAALNAHRLEEESVLHGETREPVYDPVSDTYG